MFILFDALLRHVRTRGVVILDVAECRCTGVIEPLLHPREVAHACRMRQIVRHWPDASEDRNDVRVRIRECELDRLRWWRRLTSQDRWIQIEKCGDEFSASVERGELYDPGLKLHEAVTEQRRFTF